MKKKKGKTRDEVMLLHLLKTFNCGWHKVKTKKNRQEEKKQLKNWEKDY